MYINESFASESVNNVTTNTKNLDVTSSITNTKRGKGRDALKKIEVKFEPVDEIPASYKVGKGLILDVCLKLRNVSNITWPANLEMTAGFYSGKYVEEMKKEVSHHDIADVNFTFGPWDTEGKTKAHLQFNWICDKTKTKYFSKKIHFGIHVVPNEGIIFIPKSLEIDQEFYSQKSKANISDEKLKNVYKHQTEEYRSSDKLQLIQKEYKEDIILQSKDSKNSELNKTSDIKAEQKKVEDDEDYNERLLSKSSIVN